MKRVSLMLLAAALLVTMGAFVSTGMAEDGADQPNPGYEAVTSGGNLVVEVARNAAPSVVGVYNLAKTWDPRTDKVDIVEQSSGSGVVILVKDGSAFIVTNNHVVNGNQGIEVLLPGVDERVPAEVVGVDSSTDIAVVKIEDINLTAIPMGDSDQLQVGELAIAIGNPGIYGESFDSTVTCGIISALNRNVKDTFQRRVNAIQTDAAINPGNSGGALLNAKGELIGIPSLKIGGSVFMGSASYEGLGFAVPVNTFKPVVEQLIANGKVVRPRLGVGIVDQRGPSEPLVNYPPSGSQITIVEPGSPAEKAGIKTGDVIYEVNGVRVKSNFELTAEIDRHKEGDTLTIKLYRPSEDRGATLESMLLTVEATLEILDK